MSNKPLNPASTQPQSPAGKRTDRRSPAETYLSDGVLESVLESLGGKSSSKGAVSDARSDQSHPDGGNKRRQGGLDELLRELDRGLGVDRHRAASVSTTERTEELPKSRFLIFSLSPWQMAIPLDLIMEVGAVPPATWIPHCPSWVRGAAHIRGEIYSILDAKTLFGAEPLAPKASEQMILVRSKTDAMRTVLVVDRVLGIRSLPLPKKSTANYSLAPQLDPFVEGLTEWEDQALIFLNLDGFLESPLLHPWQKMIASSSV